MHRVYCLLLPNMFTVVFAMPKRKLFLPWNSYGTFPKWEFSLSFLLSIFFSDVNTALVRNREDLFVILLLGVTNHILIRHKLKSEKADYNLAFALLIVKERNSKERSQISEGKLFNHFHHERFFRTEPKAKRRFTFCNIHY